MKWNGAGRAICLVAVVSVILAAPAAAAATTFTVSGFGDATGTCSGTVCTSLRAAVDAANGNPGSTISLSAGTYTLGNGAPVGSGELLISATGSGGAMGVTITGAGPGQTVIRQTDGEHRVLEFHNGGPYELANLEVTGGDLTGALGGIVQGGGVFSNAIVRLDRTLITGNTVVGGSGTPSSSGAGGLGGSALGGGFYDTSGNGAAGSTIADSTISGNFATGGIGGSGTTEGGEGGNGIGGGLDVDGYTIADSTISGNHASGGPGGPAGAGTAGPGGTALGGGSGGIGTSSQLLLNDTVTGNTAAGGLGPGSAGAGNGGGIGFENAGHQVFDSDTLTGNTASGGAGSAAGNVLLSSNQGLTMADTVIAAGIAPADNNCSITPNTVTDNGHNLADDALNQCRLTATNDLVDTTPGLGPLANNGGPAETELPAAGSALIRSGGACVDPTALSVNTPLTTDERGDPRSGACDIGAVQVQAATATGRPTVGGAARVGQTLTCSPLGAFAGDGLSYAYAWLRGATAIPGQISPTHVVTTGDEGATLACEVTATAITGAPAAAMSASTARVPTPVVIKPVSGKVVLGSATLSVSKGKTKVTLKCTGGQLGCAGKLKLTVVETGKAVTARAKKRKPKPKTLVLANASYKVASGRSVTLTLKIAGAGTKLLSSHHNKIPAALALTPSGGRATIHKVTLKAVVVKPKKKKHKK